MTQQEEFSQKEFLRRLRTTVEKLLAKPGIKPSDHPTGILLGGQSGAGKTTLHDVYQKVLKDNALSINGDEYRSNHPRYAEINEKYGIDSPAYTAAWAAQMVERLIDFLSRNKYNLIIEGTLRTSEVPLKTATLLRERGYNVSLALMAVKPEISLISCQLRYEQMRIAGTTPRAVDPDHHRVIVDGIVENLSTLEDSGLFDDIKLYSRSGACLYSSDTATQNAGDALRDIIFGAWTPEEKAHYNYLQECLEKAKETPQMPPSHSQDE